MRKAERLASLVLVLMLVWCAFPHTAEAGRTYTVEETPVEVLKTYPYRVVSDSFVLYLSQEDIDSQDRDAYFDGMNRFLENLEEDLSEAREYLKDYLTDDVQPIEIYTYFTKQSPRGAGIYISTANKIMLYMGWERAAESVLHEYVHYLTYDCFRYGLTEGLWVEGVAEFVSELACGNKTAKAFNYGFSDEEVAEYVSWGLTDGDGKISIRKYLWGYAASWDKPYSIGEKYTSVSGKTMMMTARIQQNPTMDQLTYPQAACFVEYLVNRFGKDRVFKHLNCNSIKFRGVYGQSFEELYSEWKQENLKKCIELGLDID